MNKPELNPSDLNRPGIYHKTIEVLPEYDDGFGRMKLQSIARTVSDTAYAHTQGNGLTDTVMDSMQIYIVLVWSAFSFRRLPRVGEKITFHTWAGKSRLGIYPRRTVVTAENGELLLTSSSQWLLIDREKRRMNPRADISSYLKPVILEGEPPLPPHRRKFPAEMSGRLSETVQPYMIDFNHHMNNSWYFDWAEDCLSENYRRGHEPKTLWAEYRHELYVEETAQISYVQEDHSLYVQGYRGEEHSFSILINYDSASVSNEAAVH